MEILTPDTKCRKLPINHGNKRPTKVIYLDTETTYTIDNKYQYHRMDMAWTCYWAKRSANEKEVEQWNYFRFAKGLCEYIESKTQQKTTLYVVAHNAFFDMQASSFFKYFSAWGWVLEFFYDKGMTYILVIRKEKAVIKVISSTNYFPIKLKKLGELVGLAKGEVDFDAATIDEKSEYCKNDVMIVKLAMEKYWKFLDTHDLGNFALSRSAQAFTAYRHRFMNIAIYPHQNEKIVDFERKAYFGGRVECHQLGEIDNGPFVTYDVNSMYPYVMRNNSFPTKLIDYVENPTSEQITIANRQYACVARVDIETDEPAYAVRYNGKIVFPIGSFETYVCSKGLYYGLAHGHIKHVNELAIYQRDFIFTDYIDYFYTLKVEYGKRNNLIMKVFCKDFQNHLYGKFGQKKPIVESADDITFGGYWREEVFDMVTGQTETITKLFNKRFVVFGFEPHPKAFVAIAAHITELARFHLWDIMKTTGFHRVLYNDTDSIKIRKCHEKCIKHPISETELGALKNEGESNKLTIHAPKHYETENKIRMKGVPANAVKIGDFEYVYNAFLGQDTHLRKKVDNYFIVRETTKKLSTKYTKGEVLSNGKVVPFLFESDEKLL